MIFRSVVSLKVFLLLFHFFGSRRFNWDIRRFDEAFHLISVLTEIVQGIFNVVDDHVNNITCAKTVSLEVCSVNCGLNVFFLSSTTQNSFLDCSFGDQSINMNFLFLTYTMCSISGLRVHGRIPIVIIKNDSVSSDQVNTETTSSSRKNKTENIGIGLELFHHEPTVLKLSASIHSEVRVLLPYKKVFKNVHHLGHLAENEASVPTFVESSHQVVKYGHLTAISDQSAVVWKL